MLEQPWTQLWLGESLALRAAAPGSGADSQPPPPPSRPSRALVDPAQGVLFDLRRDWTCLPLADLPVLSPRANELVGQFTTIAVDQRWAKAPRTEGLRTLRALLAWLGADAPVPEVDILALATTLPRMSAKRVIAFLAGQQLLVPDPAKQHDRLTIRRATGLHVVYLDELSHTVIAAWLRHRRERWPKSSNPHLLVSVRTAMDVRPQSVGLAALTAMVEPFGVTPSALRADRILDEARQTADPIHLMRLFGISDSTALKYVFAAHPERQREVVR